MASAGGSTAYLTPARYLFEKGKEEESRMVLAKLHGGKQEAGYWVLTDAGEREYEAMRAGKSRIIGGGRRADGQLSPGTRSTDRTSGPRYGRQRRHGTGPSWRVHRSRGGVCLPVASGQWAGS